MRNTAAVLVVTCVLVNICLAGFGETVYTSTLSNEQVVPRVDVKKESRGNALFFYDRYSNPPTLRVNVQHSSRYEVTEAGIYLGYAGEIGTLLYSFSGYLGSGFKNTILLEQLSLFSANYTAEQQGQDFLNGVWYIQISTSYYPDGELRGQILHNDRFYAEMSVSHSIPRALSSSASGIAVGTYSPFEPLRQLDASIIHNVQFPKTGGIEIRTGRPGVVGDKLYSFLSSGSPSFDSFVFSISEAENFLKDLLYLNIASDSNPSGEIRGQLTTIDYIGDVAFTARLDSDQVVPNVQNSTRRGCALITLNCETNLLEYLIMHNVKDATGAFIGIAQAGSPGVILFPLPSGQSPIFGAIHINEKDQLLLYARQLYVTVTSQDYPNGEIRGQIGIDYDWWAYLSGTQVVSPVTTASVGCSTFTLRGQQNRIVDYEIFHNIPDATYATLSVGRADSAGVLDRVFDTVYSPIRGADFVLDDDELEALVSDAMYVTIYSRSQPEMGQVRGQIKRINPCSTKGQLDNSLTIDAPQVNNGNNDNNNKDAEIEPRALPDPEPDTDQLPVEPVALGAIVIPSLIFAFFMMVLTW